MWPDIHNWEITPLGKGFFEFHFNTIEDMQQVWAMGVVNINPGLMRFYCWSSDFVPQAQAQTHAQIWVRFLQLPQEYWRKQTLLEIASGLGTPLIINEATLNRRFGIYARVLIDVDLSEQLFELVIVEREGHALSVLVQYEIQPSFCSHCMMLGHGIHNCLKLVSQNQTEGTTKVTKQAHPAATYNRNQSKNAWSGKRTILTQEASTSQVKHVRNGTHSESFQGVLPLHQTVVTVPTHTTGISASEATQGFLPLHIAADTVHTHATGISAFVNKNT